MYGDDASYGPVFDGQPVYHWDALDPFSPNYHQSRPWVSAQNDPTTYYETAVASNQSIAISAGGEKTTMKFGYTRSDEKGVLPNSSLDKNMFNFSASSELVKKLTITASANYSRIVGVGRFEQDITDTIQIKRSDNGGKQRQYEETKRRLLQK